MLLLRAVEPRLGARASAREVDLRLHYVLGGHHRSTDQITRSPFPVPHNFTILQQPLIAAHHLVRLGAVVLHHVAAMTLGLVTVAVPVSHRDALERKVYKARAGLRFGHALHDIRGEIQVLLRGILAVSRCNTLVEPHDRFQDRRTREARPVAGLPQLTSALSIRADLANHVIAKPLRGIEDTLSPFTVPDSAFPVIIMQQPHHRVLHSPYVPAIAASQLVGVVADVAVRLLRREHPVDAAVNCTLKPFPLALFPTRQIRGIRNRRMHPFPPELGLPPALRLGLLHKRRGDVVRVGSRDMLRDHAVELRAQRALEPHVADVVE